MLLQTCAASKIELPGPCLDRFIGSSNRGDESQLREVVCCIRTVCLAKTTRFQVLYSTALSWVHSQGTQLVLNT